MKLSQVGGIERLITENAIYGEIFLRLDRRARRLHVLGEGMERTRRDRRGVRAEQLRPRDLLGPLVLPASGGGRMPASMRGK